jgi:hypothetical protein
MIAAARIKRGGIRDFFAAVPVTARLPFIRLLDQLAVDADRAVSVLANRWRQVPSDCIFQTLCFSNRWI